VGVLRRVVQVVGLVIGVVALGVGFVWYTAFGSNSAIAPGQLVPGVETVKDSFVSAFLIDVGGGKVAMIDAGNDKHAQEILAALELRKTSVDAVVAILLTHGHGDHVGGCKMFPKAEVYALSAEIPVIGDAAKVTHPLADADKFKIGEETFEVFATPGHTPGSAVYLARGVLFFGDSAGAAKDGQFKGAVRLFSKSGDENVASLKALAARLEPRAGEVKKLAFAHTGPLDGLGPLLTFTKR
jgi:glyoxylase-like metal-dependent hydrolase (beta-lactamase superfamily II)